LPVELLALEAAQPIPVAQVAVEQEALLPADLQPVQMAIILVAQAYFLLFWELGTILLAAAALELLTSLLAVMEV
jgi:hypothetical protein